MGQVESRLIDGSSERNGWRGRAGRPLTRWSPSVDRITGLWPLAVVVRVLVAGFLVFGPATDEPGDLEGWDAERFQEIAERTEPAWAGQPVEYPPGSVVVLDRLAGSDTVSTHRRLVALSAAIDLGVAAVLGRRVGARSGQVFLLIGLPLVPLGYQRLDTLVMAVATVGALALLTPTHSRERGRGWGWGWGRRGADVVAVAAIAVGAMIKIWPAVLVVAAVAIGRWRAAVGATGLAALAGVVWLARTGAGLDPLDQVLSLRGATGWHVESLPGALVAVGGGGPARLELNAFRIGTLQPGLVTVGRVLALTMMGLLALAGLRLTPTSEAGRDRLDDERRIVALVGLGATAALLVTAPLLSPQFLVWMLPFAALLAAEPGRRHDGVVLSLAATVAVLTGVTLTAFGPSGLDRTFPAALLTFRNLALATLPFATLVALSPGIPSAGER